MKKTQHTMTSADHFLEEMYFHNVKKDEKKPVNIGLSLNKYAYMSDKPVILADIPPKIFQMVAGMMVVLVKTDNNGAWRK